MHIHETTLHPCIELLLILVLVHCLFRTILQAVFENSLPRCNLRARYSVRCTIDLMKDLRGSAPFDDSSSSSSSDDSDGGGVRDKKLSVSSSRRVEKKTQASGSRGRLLNLEASAASTSHASAATAMAEASAPSARANGTTCTMMMATITKRVPLEVARKHGLKRGDLLVAVTGPSSEPADMNLLYGTTKGERVHMERYCSNCLFIHLRIQSFEKSTKTPVIHVFCASTYGCLFLYLF